MTMGMDVKQAARRFAATILASLPKGLFTDTQFFELYQSRGWHATPVHFYLPIPDTSELSERHWEAPSRMVGIDDNIDAQCALLAGFARSGYLGEYERIVEAAAGGTHLNSGQFGGMDGAILYAMVRNYKPGRIVEIGSGQSTLIALKALERNGAENRAGTLTAIEPFPQDFLKRALREGDELIVEKVQNVPMETFERLADNDILFIDSTHVAKIGSDVLYEINEILPRLKEGVIVHVHDIFLPYEYPREWVMNRHVFWNEQYLVQAFLAFNKAFQITYSAGLMRQMRPEQLAGEFAYFDRAQPQAGSLWIRRVG